MTDLASAIFFPDGGFDLSRRRGARRGPPAHEASAADDGAAYVLTAPTRRSRRSRRGRRDEREKTQINLPLIGASPEKTILRRNYGYPMDLPPSPRAPPLPASPPPRDGNIGYGYMVYLQQRLQLQQQRERDYWLRSQAEPYYPPEADIPLLFSPAIRSPAAPPRCAACEAAVPGFHLCVLDKVTVGFRSTAGPIERPSPRRPSSSSGGEGSRSRSPALSDYSGESRPAN